MRISPIAQQNNQKKQTGFGMRMTEDTLELIGKAKVTEPVQAMIDALLHHDDKFTLKIAQQIEGGSYYPGLQHSDYPEARQWFSMKYFHQRYHSPGSNGYSPCRALENHPLVPIYHDEGQIERFIEPCAVQITRTFRELCSLSLEGLIRGLHARVFDSSFPNLDLFVEKVLKPSHAVNLEKVDKVKGHYQEIQNLLVRGQESGRFDEQTALEIQKLADKEYNNGQLYPDFDYNYMGQKYASYTNNLIYGNINSRLQAMLDCDPAAAFTVKGGELHVYHKSHPEISEKVINVDMLNEGYLGENFDFAAKYKKLLESLSSQ